MKENENRFTPEARDAAMRRLHQMTAWIVGASFAAAAVFGVVAHATIPGGTTTTAASSAAGGSSTSTASTSATSRTSSGATSAVSGSAVSGSAVAVSGGS